MVCSLSELECELTYIGVLYELECVGMCTVGLPAVLFNYSSILLRLDNGLLRRLTEM